MSVEDDRHPERKKGSLSQIKTTSSWPAFDCHTVLIEDKELRVRIEPVPEGTDSSFQKVSFSKCLVTWAGATD